MLSYLRHNRVLSVVLLIVAILTAGFLRDRRFYYVNARIKHLQGIIDYRAFEGTLPNWMMNLDLNELMWLKWGLTFIYILVFYAICHLGLVLLVKDFRPMVKVLQYLYLFGTLGALVLYGIDFIVSFNQIGYKSSRFIMHVLQSPLPLFMLFPAQFLMKR